MQETENKRALNTTEIEAAVIYRLFVDAVSLPTIYNKKSIELAINTIKEEYYKHIDAEEEEEKRIVEEFIKYLENIK
jgi:hypothetical protein